MSPCQAPHRLASCAASGLHPPLRLPLRVLLLHRFASRSSVLLSASLFGPSAPSPTMASADFWLSLSTPLDADSTRQILARSPRVLHTHLHAYVRRIYAASFRVSIGLRRIWPPHPDTSPISASCSSDQRFAYGLLRIPSRPGHPCLRLTFPLTGHVEDFHLRVGAPCRAHQKKWPHGCAAIPADESVKRSNPRKSTGNRD